MKQERNEQVMKILEEYRDEYTKNGKIAPAIGSQMDPNLKENIGIYMRELKRDSDTIKKLEGLGFKAIYPAELSEEAIARMSTAERYVYDEQMKDALIIDGKETNHSLDFAKMISDHYLSTDTSHHFWGLYNEDKSIKRYIESNHKEGTAENLVELLGSVGFKTAIEGEKEDKSVSISSDIPYPTVRKSKFEQIYDKAKGKIQGVFAKLKTLVNPKDQVKENDTNERE